MGSYDFANPQSMNGYAYTLNNPTSCLIRLDYMEESPALRTTTAAAADLAAAVTGATAEAVGAVEG